MELGARGGRLDLRAATPTEADDAAKRTESALSWCFIVVRSVLLTQALLVTVLARGSYRDPRLNQTAFVVVLTESSALFWWARRRQALDNSRLIWIDSGVAVFGLLAMAVATTSVDRTAWVNWMCPFSYSVAGAAAIATTLFQGTVVAVLLVGTYLATVASSIGINSSQAATAVANALSRAGLLRRRAGRHHRPPAGVPTGG